MTAAQDPEHYPWRTAAELRSHIIERLAPTQVPDDLPGAAAARVAPEILAAWFRMPLQPAAVLLALTERDGELHLLLTERARSVTDHPGEVAFPGGSAESSDPDLIVTALRESEEEVGLSPEQVAVAGFLPAQAVISGFAVLPVVGFYEPDFQPRLDTREVNAVFETPLNFLLDTNNLQRVDRERNGVLLPTYEYHYDGHMIWGATALMIRQFIAILTHGEDADPRQVFPPPDTTE